MKTRLTSDDRSSVRKVLERAKTAGVDPVVALNREGWIATAELRVLWVANALDEIAVMLDDMTIKQIADLLERRMPTSPLDAKRYIVEIIRKTREGLNIGQRVEEEKE